MKESDGSSPIDELISFFEEYDADSAKEILQEDARRTQFQELLEQTKRALDEGFRANNTWHMRHIIVTAIFFIGGMLSGVFVERLKPDSELPRRSACAEEVIQKGVKQ